MLKVRRLTGVMVSVCESGGRRGSIGGQEGLNIGCSGGDLKLFQAAFSQFHYAFRLDGLCFC